MSLRLRLMAAMATVLVLIAIGGAIVVRTQRSFLIEQIDEQLSAAMPFARIPAPPAGPIQPPEPPDDRETPISTLFVGLIADGELTPVLQGRLLTDTPDVTSLADELDGLDDAPATVDGVEGRQRFRIRISPIGDDHLAVALPLDEVDSAIHRLQLVLLIVGALVFVVIALAVWWVERLGIRPIQRVTRAAASISAGDRSRRAPATDLRTEAGQLAQAFNLMLDDRDAAEALRRQFVADASHELRTPLTSIQGYLELYEHGRFTDSGQVEDMLRRMGRETTRMRDLVEDLLLLANLDQHRPLRSDAVDLSQIVADAATDARAVQSERTITVDIPGEAVVVTGDQFRLQQVVGALVDNALTHTDVDVAVHLAVEATPQRARIVVADEGPGLAPEVAARVFDRFFRGDESRSRRTGNSGLGLAIARSIVDAHGGDIELTTSPGHGCTFTITLPLDRTGT